MLPKPDKTKKKSVEQLDILDSLSIEKKLQNKRRFILFVLILTVGLSLCFWIYTFIKRTLSSPPTLSLSLNLSRFNPQIILPNKLDIKKEIYDILGNNASNWLVLYQTNPPTDNFYWPDNNTNSFFTGNTSKIMNDLDKLEVNPSLITDALPPGASVKQSVFSQDNINEWRFLISVPQKQILMMFRFTGSVESAQKILPLLVEKLYWFSLKS
ncbi:MAG: hypothetical protein Q8P53_03460 [Candidatus Shapirobacteria bacterium]|nr:hypothetical protein [Candidatus Shapirobacteria bacterium]